MKNFARVLSITDKKSIEKEMMLAGVHKDGISIMAPKAMFDVVKVTDIPVTAANIIKQEILARGGDAATAYGAVNHSVRRTDVLIFGTRPQFSSLIKKLGSQYFGLKDIASDIREALDNNERAPEPIKIGKKRFNFGKRTYIMGILNITADSFSDGGLFLDQDAAVEQGIRMADEGADIIDVGGESTRPGASPVNEKTEISRVIPVIKKLKKLTGAVISIDTTKSRVAEAALKAGADMVNDISGMAFDKRMVRVVAAHRCPVILMHIKGNPRTMQKNPVYRDVISEIIIHLKKSVELAIKGGAPEEKIIIDPGIGFGKTTEHNLEILRRLREFRSLGRPILVGTSRKSVIGNVLGLPAGERLEGTAATVAAAVMNGADIVRVHDTAEMARVAKMTDAIARS